MSNAEGRRGDTAPRSRVLPGPAKRFLSVLSDERLVQRVAHGDDDAFEVLFDRHQQGVGTLCASIMRSPHDGEEVAQHAFLAAYRALRDGPPPDRLRPWLYAIARNRSISALRGRRADREAPSADLEELPAPDLSEQVERRADLVQVLHDIGELPEDQRAALVLSEAGDLPHREIAIVLRCEPSKVKSLVYQARSGLMQRREARDTPCAAFREEIASRRGGALAWTPLRRHVAHCPGCAEFLEDVRAQRAELGLAWPLLLPGLRESVMAALAAERSAAAAATAGTAATAGVAGGETAKGGLAAWFAARAGGRLAIVLGGGGGLSAPGAMVAKTGVAKAAVVVLAAGGASVGGGVLLSDRAEPDRLAQAERREAPASSQNGRERRASPPPGGERAREAAQRRLARAQLRRVERELPKAPRTPQPPAPADPEAGPESGPATPQIPAPQIPDPGGPGVPDVPDPPLPPPPRVPELPLPR